MSSEIYKEIDIFLKAIFLGAGICITYDVFRILRRIYKKGTIITGFEDVIFCIFTAIVIFSFLYSMNGGIIRSYIYMGIFIGIVVYEESIGKYVVKYTSKIIKKFLILLKKILQPFKMLIDKCVCVKRGADIEEKKKHKKKKRTE